MTGLIVLHTHLTHTISHLHKGIFGDSAVVGEVQKNEEVEQTDEVEDEVVENGSDDEQQHYNDDYGSDS